MTFSLASGPDLALLIFLAGALGIYLEFCRPGLVFPGAVGLSLILLSIGAFARLPIGWVGVSLVSLTPLLFLAEAKWPGHKIFTVTGVISTLIGSKLLINSRHPELRIHWAMAIATIPFSLLTAFLISVALCARRNKAVAREAEKRS